jgi:hypothetical protein
MAVTKNRNVANPPDSLARRWPSIRPKGFAPVLRRTNTRMATKAPM